LFQLLISRSFWNARWNEPGLSSLKKARAHAAMKALWNFFWKKERFQP
jgi:hypothetical protein